MHISAKICLALGLVAGIIGAVLMAIGVDTLSDIEEFQYEGITSGELSVDDKDGKGDLGFTIYIEGEPGDS
ncbi:MAG: hypothetical protein QF440_05875, partial [Candidatus Thalassarchaeaceae archaeon]|nr:hypothetical protein [Candidatus Thalassarchaeaceae archaeon]